MARQSRAQLKARIFIAAIISLIVVAAVTVFATRIRFRSDAQENWPTRPILRPFSSRPA